MYQKIILGIAVSFLFMPIISIAASSNAFSFQKIESIHETTPHLKSRTEQIKNNFEDRESILPNVATKISRIKERINLIKNGRDGDDGEDPTSPTYSLRLSTTTVETYADSQGEDDTVGVYIISFDVTAVSDDVYIKNSVNNTASGTDAGIAYAYEGQLAPSESNSFLHSSGEIIDGVFLVEEGETERLTLTVTSRFKVSGQRRVVLKEINFTNNSDGISEVKTLIPPSSVFRTPYTNINGSSISNPD